MVSWTRRRDAVNRHRMLDSGALVQEPPGDDARGLLASLVTLNQHALRWMFGSAKASSLFNSNVSLFAVKRDDVSRSRTVCNGFMAKSLLHRLHRRACTGVCAFVVVDVTCTKQVS